MAQTLARLSGVMLRPGVSRNGRYYSPEMIAKAVERAQARIADGAEPLTMLTHHDAEDDSEKIVGGLRKVWLGDDGSAMYEAEMPDTGPARTIAKLADTSGGAPFLRNVSIRGYWLGEPRTVEMEGQTVVTADDMELDGLDFTKSPGVPGARIDSLELVGAGGPAESGPRARFRITESVQEARVTVTEDAPAATVTPTAGVQVGQFADASFGQTLPIGTPGQARETWHALRRPAVAERFTAKQLQRCRENTRTALRRHGVEVLDNGWLMERARPTPEPVREYLDWLEVPVDVGDALAAATMPSGSFTAQIDNGTVCICISSYRVDPHDLTRVARAAMDGAAAAIEGLDPDDDGDIDVPAEKGPDAGPSAAESVDEPPAGVSESDADTAALAASEPSPDSAPVEKDSIEEEGEPGMAEPTTTPAAGAPAVTLSAEQFDALMARVSAPAAAPVETAPAAPVAEAAPAAAPVAEAAPTAADIERIVAERVAAATAHLAPAAPAAAAPVVEETTEQMIARLVEQGVRSTVQGLAESGAVGARKGIVVDRGNPTDGPRESADGVVVPEGVRDVPAHEWTPQEWRVVRAQMGLEAAGLAGEPRNL